MLHPWVLVCEPDRWKKAIMQDILSGPESNRAITRALIRDMEALRDMEARKLFDD